MATEFRVTLYELIRRVEELYALAEQLQREIFILEGIEGRLNMMWEGEARALFHQYFTRDLYRIQNYQRIVVNYADRLQSVYMRYTTAELATSEIMRIHLV